jgi:hypothetical protein
MPTKAHTMYYFYINAKGEVEKASSETFIALIQSGSIQSDTKVWREGSATYDYVAADTFEELKGYFAPPPVPPPPAPVVHTASVVVTPTVSTAVIAEVPNEKKEKNRLDWLYKNKIAVGVSLLLVLVGFWFLKPTPDKKWGSILEDEKEVKHQLIAKYFGKAQSQDMMQVATGNVQVTLSNSSTEQIFTIHRIRIPISRIIGRDGNEERNCSVILQPGEQKTISLNFGAGSSAGEPIVLDSWITIKEK